MSRRVGFENCNISHRGWAVKKKVSQTRERYFREDSHSRASLVWRI